MVNTRTARGALAAENLRTVITTLQDDGKAVRLHRIPDKPADAEAIRGYVRCPRHNEGLENDLAPVSVIMIDAP
jgi:hypothetical protein